jgi:hypothetical protein
VADLHREPSTVERWLRALTDAQQSVVARLYLAAIQEECSSPEAVHAHAVASLAARIEAADAAERPGLRRIATHLDTHQVGALAFAQDRLDWVALPEAEKARRREASRQAFQQRQLERLQAKRAAWAQAGGR